MISQKNLIFYRKNISNPKKFYHLILKLVDWNLLSIKQKFNFLIENNILIINSKQINKRKIHQDSKLTKIESYNLEDIYLIIN